MTPIVPRDYESTCTGSLSPTPVPRSCGTGVLAVRWAATRLYGSLVAGFARDMMAGLHGGEKRLCRVEVMPENNTMHDIDLYYVKFISDMSLHG